MCSRPASEFCHLSLSSSKTLPELANELTFFRSECLALNNATGGGGSGEMLLEVTINLVCHWPISAKRNTVILTFFLPLALKRLLSIIDKLLSSGPLGDNKKVSKLLGLTENAIRMVTLLLKEPQTLMESDQTGTRPEPRPRVEFLQTSCRFS